MGEAHGPGARLRTGLGAMTAQLPLHFLEKDPQHLPRQRRVALQKTSQAFGQRQYPLAQLLGCKPSLGREPSLDLLSSRSQDCECPLDIRSLLTHAPGVARRTRTPCFAREADQVVVTAVFAPRTRKAVGEDSAFQGD